MKKSILTAAIALFSLTSVAQTAHPECPTDGTCGSAHGTTVAAAPSGNDLCLSGTSSAVVDGTQYSWTCTGEQGGTAQSCSASKLSNVPSYGTICLLRENPKFRGSAGRNLAVSTDTDYCRNSYIDVVGGTGFRTTNPDPSVTWQRTASDGAEYNSYFWITSGDTSEPFRSGAIACIQYFTGLGPQTLLDARGICPMGTHLADPKCNGRGCAPYMRPGIECPAGFSLVEIDLSFRYCVKD